MHGRVTVLEKIGVALAEEMHLMTPSKDYEMHKYTCFLLNGSVLFFYAYSFKIENDIAYFDIGLDKPKYVNGVERVTGYGVK